MEKGEAMSLILKGIDMPKDCDDCMFNFYREGDSCPACYLTKHIVIRKKKESIPTDCPLVGIPSPHGRMIDADALFDAMGLDTVKEVMLRNWKFTTAWGVPIIEAEE